VKASDPSIRVRDAVLEFISKLIFSTPLHDEKQVDLIESVLLGLKYVVIFILLSFNLL